MISSQFCADNNIDQDVKTCHGDSGGPSIVRKFVDGAEQFVLIGVVSGGLGIRCGTAPGVPDFYSFTPMWLMKRYFILSNKK